MSNIEIQKIDITKLAVDVIVNAANRTLLGGGGVDGAIHRAAGPQLLEECETLNGCNTGDTKITKGYNLPAKYVIHAVVPIWRGGVNSEPEFLASCYRKSMQLATEYGLKSIAFPNISTGVYGFPKQLAAEIAIAEVRKFLSSDNRIEKVIFAVFDDENYSIYTKLLG